LVEAASSGKIYFDKNLLNRLKEKMIIIKKLKGLVAKVLTDQHQEKDMRDLIKELKEIQNYDFSLEIRQVEGKLRIIHEVQ